MKWYWWTLLVVVVCSPVGLLAYGYRFPGTGPQFVRVTGVPDGDQELAWLNTTTAGSTWERFVAGVRWAGGGPNGFIVDDANAFPEQTTAVPEVSIRTAGKRGRLHIRWYKVSGDHPPKQWLKQLAARSPAPLAIIGGGSSDRARDLAWALNRRTTWQGDRPLFVITTATAEKVHTGPDESEGTDGGQTTDLLKIYDGRSLRFCFNNRQMAEAIVDFVWQSPTLRPQSLVDSKPPSPAPPTVFYIDWDDDPYSSDLISQFRDVFLSSRGPKPTPHLSGWKVPFSIGGFSSPNRWEEEAADAMLKELRGLPAQRSLLIVPTVAAAARRVLRTIAEAYPAAGQQLVAVNGDGMGVNTVLRDGEFAWPVRALTIPLVMFTHNNPIGWDTAEPPGGYKLEPPNSTEDVLHFADLTTTLATAAFAPDDPDLPLVRRADELAARLRNRPPILFDDTGNRTSGRGEHVVVVVPRTDHVAVGLPDAVVQVWRRAANGTWQLVGDRPLTHSRRTRE